MKAVMISIRPKWCELIASGKKTIEVRKTKPKIETPFKCYIYETKDRDKKYYDIFHENTIGKVIGEFVCDKITDMRDMGGEEFFSASCMTYEDWRNYTDYTKHIIWGWHISDLKIYDKPKELSEFRKPCADNYRYCPGCEHGLCQYPEWVETYEDLADCCIEIVCLNTVTKPPQSWCYVESGR